MTDLKKVIKKVMKDVLSFNNDQKKHEQLFAEQVIELINKLMVEATTHDASKWLDKELETFIEARSSLRGSKDGKDEAYQKLLNSEAIQHHITENPHHPEYWDKRNKKMPVHQCICMFFDWRSRCIQKGGTMDDFWEFNIAKLTNQPHAIPIVEALKEEYAD